MSQPKNDLDLALKLIETCRLAEALELLEKELSMNLDSEGIVFAIKCCKFWAGVLGSSGKRSAFEQGEALVNQWKQFLIAFPIPTESHEICDKTVYSFKKCVFSLALEAYAKAGEEEKDGRFKSEILRKTGLCYKKLGSYETALGCLKEANCELGGQASVISEMADCYALCGETRNAKMLFREAFYIDAHKVELSFLDSPMITALVQKVRDVGKDGEGLCEWVAVYGVILGVFNVKRLLLPQEVIRLRQEIFATESEIKDPKSDEKVLRPRLLNLYFWLLDYYVLSKESSGSISEIMLKMKILDPEIYELYR